MIKGKCTAMVDHAPCGQSLPCVQHRLTCMSIPLDEQIAQIVEDCLLYDHYEFFFDTLARATLTNLVLERKRRRT